MKVKRVGWQKINGDFLLHSHLYHEMLYISSGEGKVRFGEEERAVSEGDILFVPAGTEHTGPGGASCGVIYLIADHPLPFNISGHFIIRDNENRSIRAYFENIYEIFTRPDSDISYKKVENTLCDLIFELVFSLQGENGLDTDVSRLCGVIQKDFSKPDFNLGAEMARITPSVT